MIIGTCVRLDVLENMPEKLEKLSKNGFTTCQLLSWNMELYTDEYEEGLKALLEKYGVTPSAFWAGWDGPKVWNFYEGQTTLGLVPPEYREMRIKNLCDGADFAKKLGIT
ncbi:MAG: sugar phosphate isomerase/epimerase, partial [Firmicutes bacterium]|nr:sugar phosphate isomerase/epimerase [Candidatus Colimorpha enterica]